MCGISGIISGNGTPIEEKSIGMLNAQIAHRGPDDEGFFYGNGLAFGHRRLSILDLSSGGHQPMSYLDRYTITYNGEVYNYVEIKAELTAAGYTFDTQTDTEVILAAYDMWGTDCVGRFNGMWAFAIYDSVAQTVFCSRDRFGIKPFYYAQAGEYFVFGSEIKQLLPFLPERIVNKKILMDYLVLNYEDHTDETFFEGVFKLPQSHNLIYDLQTHAYSLQRYYEINIDPELSRLEESAAVDLYKSSLLNAVRFRLRSDVKVGTCLSGGLDSSSVAAIASSLYNNEARKMSAVHAKSTESASDESRYAQEVARHCSLDLHTIEPTADEFQNCLKDVLFTQEEPFGSPSIVMQYLVFKKARDIGCKVMLDGQGGDETLLGYERYYPAYLDSLSGLDRLKGFLLCSRNSRLSLLKVVQYYVYFTLPAIRLYRLKKKMHFVKDTFFQYINTDAMETSACNYRDILALQKQEILSLQMPHLLKYEDKNSMRHSIEARLPFIDYVNLENALAINGDFKIKKGWTKYILRRAVESLLPRSIVWRTDKMGFEAPVSTWLKGLAPVMQASVENSSILKTLCTEVDLNTLDHKTKWKLFNIAEWEKAFDVKIN